MALEIVTLVVRGMMSLTPSLATGIPYPGPTSWHREPIDLAWIQKEKEKGSNKVLKLCSNRGLRCLNGGILTLSVGVRWQS